MKLREGRPGRCRCSTYTDLSKRGTCEILAASPAAVFLHAGRWLQYRPAEANTAVGNPPPSNPLGFFPTGSLGNRWLVKLEVVPGSSCFQLARTRARCLAPRRSRARAATSALFQEQAGTSPAQTEDHPEELRPQCRGSGQRCPSMP